MIASAKTLTFVSHGSPGSGPSLLMRALRHAVMEVGTDAEIEVVDRPGEGGAEAIRAVGDNEGSPNVLGSCTPTYLTAPIKQDLPYHVGNLTPVSGLVLDTYYIAVSGTSKVSTVAELLSSRSRMAAGPMGGNAHIQAMLIGDEVDVPIDITFVANQQAAVAAVVEGQVDWTTGVQSDFSEALATGELRLLASFEEGSDEASVPSLAGSGIDVVFPLWRGVIAPGGLPGDALEEWEHVIAAARGADAWADYLNTTGLRDCTWGAESFASVLHREADHYRTWMERVMQASWPDRGT